jgi:predicted TIM-barrel fold metal-dependent hydrolase
MVLPNNGLQGQLDGMQLAAESVGVAGWKCYTPWGPENNLLLTPGGYRLDDPNIGIPFIEKGRTLGVKTFCCHKGLPLPTFNPLMAMPDDIGVVAAAYPDCNFIVYHSAYQAGGAGLEGPYVEGNRIGINSLITVMRERGIGPGSNIFAELGTTWYQVMADPNQAAHVLGKLLLHVGEDNIVWGTDSIWYGSPQPIIEALRRFEITPTFQQQYGYPALTVERKRKILGLNAARLFDVDPAAVRCTLPGEIARAKTYLDGEFGRRRWALTNQPLGPRTRREFLSFQKLMRFLNVPG